MFTDLKVYDIKGIKACTLNDLGKMNALCGKNNSGKTTVLEGISDGQHHAVGRPLNKDDANALCAKCVHSMGWGEQRPVLDREFLAIVVGILANKELWYKDEVKLFADDVESRFSRHGDLARFRFDVDQVQGAYLSFFDEDATVVLLPAKRRMETAKTVRGNDPTRPSGEGVLNQLVVDNLARITDMEER